MWTTARWRIGAGGAVGPTGPCRIDAPHLVEGFGGEVVLRDLMDELAIVAEEGAEQPVAQPHRAPDDGVEDRLDVGLGLADDPQDLARRGLLVQGLGEGPIACLQLREQAHILDGDDGLAGERHQDRHLLVRERPRRPPPLDGDGAEGNPVPHHGHRQHAAKPHRVPEGIQVVLGVLTHVRDVGGTAGHDRSPAGVRSVRRHRVRLPQGTGLLGLGIVEGLDVKQLALISEDSRRIRPAQSPSVLHDGVEDGFDVGR
jgi:hypothetical protein